MSINTQELANHVRNWVHYDNLTTSLSRQSQNARKVRDDFEGRIMKMLEENNMENATIQIQGGKLSIVEEKHSQPWTLTRLEEALKGYFNQPAPLRGGGSATADQQVGLIMKYLRSNKGVEIHKRLKKQIQVPGLPPLPPPPSSS